MPNQNDHDSPGEQSALYSNRAADFHSLVTGSLRDKNAVDHYTRLVREHGETAAIIDIGCGTGDVLNALSTSLQTTRLVGVDVVDDMLDIGRKESLALADSASGPSPEFVNSDMHTVSNDYPEFKDAFDLVISRWTYHHSKDLSRIFSVTQSLLKPNGWHVFLSNVVQAFSNSASPATYQVQLSEDFAVTNYALTVEDYLNALADSGFMTSEVALYSADHKIVHDPSELWFRKNGSLSTSVFTGIFVAQLVS
ncbi:MAG: methyltransferase domain-containing protein [Pseudomonadota bacterium]